jgi:hypothetical protein
MNPDQSSLKPSQPRRIALSAGVIGQLPARIFTLWRRANWVLVLAVSLAGLAVADSLRRGDEVSRPRAAIAATIPADTTQPAGPAPADYRRLFTSRQLFVPAVAPPPGPDLNDAIARAKARLTLRGIMKVGDRMGAYFEVRDAAAGQPAAPRPLPVARGGRALPVVRHVATGGGGKVSVYFEGDQVGEFTVKKVDAKTVVLEIAGREVPFST